MFLYGSSNDVLLVENSGGYTITIMAFPALQPLTARLHDNFGELATTWWGIMK